MACKHTRWRRTEVPPGPPAGVGGGPREEAAALAREAGILETAIRRVLAEPEPLGYRPPLYYVDRMREVARLGDGSGEIVGGTPPSRRAG